LVNPAGARAVQFILAVATVKQPRDQSPHPLRCQETSDRDSDNEGLAVGRLRLRTFSQGLAFLRRFEIIQSVPRPQRRLS